MVNTPQKRWGRRLACLLVVVALAPTAQAQKAPDPSADNAQPQQGASQLDLSTLWKHLRDNLQPTDHSQLGHSQMHRAGGSQPSPVNGSVVVVKPQGRVEMHVSNVPLATVLRMLSTQTRKNIVAGPAVKGTVTADLFDVTFQEALDSILRSNDCGFEEQGNFIYVYTLDELVKRREAETEITPISRLFRLSYASVQDVKPMIEPLLSEKGRIAVTPEASTGLATSAEQAGGNELAISDAILVYDYPDRVQAIEEIIRELDVRPKQVLIEATILRAQLGEDNALGIDFTIVGGVDFEMLGAQSVGVTDLATGVVPQVELNNTSMTVRTDLTDAVPVGGLTFGIIKDQIAVFLRALEQVTDTTVLANPKVLTLNKQRGEVIVGRRDGYLTTTVTETTAIQTVDFLETGTQLVFRPFIGNDGYVRMEIHPEDSSGGLNEANLPWERTTEVTTNILVRDGHTVLIAGLFRETTTATHGQVPYAGDIPVLGSLFRTTSDTTGREEVIILLTVHIVKDNGAYAKAGDDMAEDVMRTRIGARKGIQAFGRDRLAMAHYHWALEHFDAGDYDKALWDVRMSLHISPVYLPALKLKEELVGRHACDRWTGTVRDFITRRLIGDTTLGRVTPPSVMPEQQESGVAPAHEEPEGKQPLDPRDESENKESNP